MTDLSNIKPKSLYAKRQPVYPQKIDGRFRRLKWAIMAVALLRLPFGESEVWRRIGRALLTPLV